MGQKRKRRKARRTPRPLAASRTRAAAMAAATRGRARVFQDKHRVPPKAEGEIAHGRAEYDGE
jgi:hypothetical protein